MKIFLLAIFCQLSFISPAQVRSAMPPEAATFYTNAMCCIKPEIRNQIEKNASDLKSNNADSLKKALKQNNVFIWNHEGQLFAMDKSYLVVPNSLTNQKEYQNSFFVVM